MKNHINLLPKQHLRSRATARAVAVWGAMTILFSVVLGVLGHAEWHGAMTSNDRVVALELEFCPLKEVKADVFLKRTQLAVLQEHVLTAKQTVNLQPVLGLLSAIGEAAKDTNGHVCVQSFELIKNPSTSGHQINSGYRLSIKGVSVDNLSIASFTAALKKSNRFNSVNLKSNKGVQVSNQTARSYHLECTY